MFARLLTRAVRSNSLVDLTSDFVVRRASGGARENNIEWLVYANE